jgi:hypothetical protein
MSVDGDDSTPRKTASFPVERPRTRTVVEQRTA